MLDDGISRFHNLNTSIFYNISEEITFEHVPNPQHPELNCDARIQCQVTGNPTPEISWRFNGKPIECSDFVISKQY